MIPKQLAEGLSLQEILFNQRIATVEGGAVTTVTGSTYNADFVLVATDQLQSPIRAKKSVGAYHSVTNMYFTTQKKPFKKPLIALNTLPGKLVNNIAVMDQISPAYSKNGDALISLSLVGDHAKTNATELQASVIAELKFWYPEAVSWAHLKTYHINYALPDDDYVCNEPKYTDMRLDTQCFVCGDHLMNGSINAAMKSGRLAAEAIINTMRES
jgi:predicted NAD/FAD-dependent oxidoreductase